MLPETGTPTNDEEARASWLSHTELMKGAILHFEGTAEPDKHRGADLQDYPNSFSKNR